MEHLSAPSPTGNAPYWETPNALEVKP
jgi:hypothetical protein